jgi:hypothetical protein
MKLVQRMKEQKAAQREKDTRRAAKSKRTKAERTVRVCLTEMDTGGCHLFPYSRLLA